MDERIKFVARLLDGENSRLKTARAIQLDWITHCNDYSESLVKYDARIL